MKTAALNRNMVVENKGGMTVMERIKKYFEENSSIIAGGFLMMSGGNLVAAYRSMRKQQTQPAEKEEAFQKREGQAVPPRPSLFVLSQTKNLTDGFRDMMLGYRWFR